MMRRTFPAAMLGIVLSMPAAAPTRAGAEEPLRAKIDAVLNAPDYKNARWGLLVVEAGTGKVVYERDADKLFAPASVTKLYSVAAALDAFGADHRFRTPVVRRGEVDADGRLHGDLILIASGDPNMGGRAAGGKIAFKDGDHTYAQFGDKSELTEPDPLAGLNELAAQIAAAGVRRVTGDVLIDDRLFDRAEGTGSGPSRLTPILINDNVVDVLITPGSTAAAAGGAGGNGGGPASSPERLPTATVTHRPQSPAITVDALVDTAPAGSRPDISIRWATPGRLVVRGRVPEDHKPLLRIAEVEDAAAFARSLFIDALRRAGVAVEASGLDANRATNLPTRAETANLPKVAELVSLPFSEEAKLILKVSHNLHASTLPLLLAAKHGRRTEAEGLRYQRDFLAKAGVDTDAISFGGGAGGSRADMTTPRATVQLLTAMSKRPDFAAYEAALPVLGVDGTLADAVKPDSPARGAARAKTGTFVWTNALNGRYLLTSKALAGYLTAADGRRLIFAMFVNNTHIRTAADSAREGQVLGRLCEILHAGGGR